MFPGFRVGHREDFRLATGCTVFLFDVPNVAVASVHGGAPGSRELPALFPGRLVSGVDAIVLSGGSAFGLRCAEGVVTFLRERKKGFATRAIPVPIVAQAVIYDLEVGEVAFPEAEWGYEAALRASDVLREGTVGVGTGATVGKRHGMSWAMKGGFGAGKADLREGSVWAFVVTNSLGDVYNPKSGTLLAGSRGRDTEGIAPFPLNTTLAVVVFEFSLLREELLALASVVHSALATCIRPFGTLYDGDVLFLVALGKNAPRDYLLLVQGVYEAITEATLNSVKKAAPLYGIPSCMVQ